MCVSIFSAASLIYYNRRAVLTSPLFIILSQFQKSWRHEKRLCYKFRCVIFVYSSIKIFLKISGLFSITWTTTDQMETRFSLNNLPTNKLRIHLADTTHSYLMREGYLVTFHKIKKQVKYIELLPPRVIEK